MANKLLASIGLGPDTFDIQGWTQENATATTNVPANTFTPGATLQVTTAGIYQIRANVFFPTAASTGVTVRGFRVLWGNETLLRLVLPSPNNSSWNNALFCYYVKNTNNPAEIKIDMYTSQAANNSTSRLDVSRIITLGGVVKTHKNSICYRPQYRRAVA